jgi:predicted DCC family thiol-disulfide oxidoreductase YuxK
VSDPIILFDGFCNLCGGAVEWIIRRDHRGLFRFAPLQSPQASQILSRTGTATPPDQSLILLEGNRVFMQSTAALRIARRLSGPWPLLYALILVPGPIRDLAYRWIARRRYRWFGKADSCHAPPPGRRAGHRG